MDCLKEGIKAVAVGVSGSKPIPEDLVSPLIQVCASYGCLAVTCIRNREMDETTSKQARSYEVLDLWW